MNIAIIFPENRGLNFKVLPHHVELVHNAFPDAEIMCSADGSDLIEKGFAAEIIIAWGDPHYVDLGYLLWNKNLKWIHCLSAGVEKLLATDVVKIPGLRITNSKGIHETPISEHVIGYLLCHYRKMKVIYENQKQEYWYRGFDPVELSGRTACIVGAGAIGQGIARRLKAFDVTVYGVKRTPAALKNFDRVYTTEHLDEALVEADIVIMAAPLTPETEGMFNAERFAAMKNRPVFINVGRGRSVVTDDLVSALTSGTLSGAMMDAVEPEPLTPGHPLWSMNNVLVSPHISADSDKYFQRAFQKFVSMADCYRDGSPFPNEIDLSRSY